MTTEEVLPVLLALRENPTTTAVFADWFDERGHHGTADLLRSWKWQRWEIENGQQIVKAIANGTERDGVRYDPHPVCRQAVIDKAMADINWRELDDLSWLDQDLRHTRGVSEYLLGTQPAFWVRVPHDPRWDWNRSVRYTCVSPDGRDARRVTLRLIRLKWGPRYITICGGLLELTVRVWVGRDPFIGRPIVTRYHRDLVSDPVLKELPF